MKILSAEQIRQWDTFTILKKNIESIDLMEAAASACAEWILAHYPDLQKKVLIFCGKGNNGGDGLAIARLITTFYSQVSVFIIETGKPGSADFQQNLTRLHQISTDIHFIQQDLPLPVISKTDLVIDAIFGTGLNSSPEGLTSEVIMHANDSGADVISIDLPSGMYADKTSRGNEVVKARHTLSFESYKLAFLVDENAANFGQLHILSIGLDAEFLETINSDYILLDLDLLRRIYRPRNQFTHKGNYGHALLITGSYGLMGASVLATRACLRAGAGKVDCQVPACGYEIMQISAPEAMTVVNGIQNLNSFTPGKNYEAVGVGPGIGRYSENGRLLKELFESYPLPIVIDADALYALAKEPEKIFAIPAETVLTPHGYEFERLFGKATDDFHRIQLAVEKANNLGCYIVLKGHHTLIVTPEQQVYFNSTGNAGMATGGSGDVLTGIITGLMAQGYPSLEASLLGVYLHGLAGDIAAQEKGMESLIAGDLVEYLGKAFIEILDFKF
jgi:ADP-dependent NAD(P)H-hydrate dehydratase / NAD(P)H-hydrate epimerase